MIESIVFLLSVVIIAYLIRIYLTQRQQEIDFKHRINTESTTVDLSSAYDEQFKLFDTRINSTWGVINSTKEELNALKLSIAIKGK
jgi:hypothetical protein